MGTPQKNVGRLLESPYAKHLQQYPSQSVEFVPNEFGGNNSMPSSTPFKQQHQGNMGQWRRGNNRYYNGNKGDTNCGNNIPNNIKGGRVYRNCQYNFESNYNPQQKQRHSNIGNRQQPYHGQQFNKSNCSFTNDYYHPSMLGDPWKELLDRHHAIQNSHIDAATLKAAGQEHEPSYEKKRLPQKDYTTAITPNAMT